MGRRQLGPGSCDFWAKSASETQSESQSKSRGRQRHGPSDSEILCHPRATVLGFIAVSLTPVAGSIFGHFPRLIFLKVSSRTAISPDFALFFK